ncbi:MAG TPA: hypothetical protein VMN38_01355 [Sphingomicrobium sp.]|nr:hypothetical protein [Sphingomicrobium sp.]
MVILAAAAIVAAAPAQEAVQPSSPIAVQRQAQAMVRIVSSAAVRFSEIERDRPEALRETMIRGPNGTPEAAKLVEFQ